MKLTAVVLPLFFAVMSLVSMTVDAKIFSEIEIGGKRYRALVDTGADMTIIPDDIVSHGMLIQQTGSGTFTMANGDEVRARIYSARVSMGGMPPAILEVAVLPGAEMLIGMNALKVFRARIDPYRGTLEFPASAYQPTHTKNELPHSPRQVFKPYVERLYRGEIHPGC